MRHAIAALITLATAPALAGPGGYDFISTTHDSGGGQMSGGGYTLIGTVAQSDAGPTLSNASTTLEPGFWPSVLAAPPCPADLTGDGLLNNTDINAFVSAFLAELPAGDLNGDTLFNNTDINLFVQAFLAGCD